MITQEKQSWERWMRWEQHANPSSHWTIGLRRNWFFLLLSGLFVLHLRLAAILPLTDDELYYWSWAQKIQLSYFDHPFMVALWIRGSTFLFGNSPLAVRFSAILAFFSIFLLLSKFSGPKKQLLGLTLLTPISLFGAVLMTPDVPFLFFWTLYIWWMVSLNKAFSPWGDDPIARVYRHSPIHWEQWFLGGLILALGILSKYSMFLAIPSSFIVLFTRYRLNSWLKGYLFHLSIGAMALIPILLFNNQHGFAPLHFQFDHTLGNRVGNFTGFFSSQALLVGALPWLLLPFILIWVRELSEHPGLHVCLIFYLIPFASSIFVSFRNYVEANWALMSYLSFWPVAQYLVDHHTFKLFAKILISFCFGPPIVVSLLVFVHLVKPLSFIKPEQDRLGRYRETFQLAQVVSNDLVLNQITETLFLTTYQWTAQFRYQGLKAHHLTPLGRRSNFTLTAENPCNSNTVLVFSTSKETGLSPLSCFTQSEVLREYPLTLRGTVLETYHLIRYTK